jgi:hypothetical protein
MLHNLQKKCFINLAAITLANVTLKDYIVIVTGDFGAIRVIR